MTTRLDRLQVYMEQHELDAILITQPKHVYYLTGLATDPHERFLGLVLSQTKEPVLVVPALDEEAARVAKGVREIVTHTDTQDPYAILKSILPTKISRFGIEKTHMTVSRFEALSAAAGAEQYVDIDEPLRVMRLIKSSEEIVRMRNAVRIIEDVLREGLKHVKPGVKEIELVAELEYQMKKLGSDGPSFDTMVLAGDKSALPHGKPDTREVRNGELLLFDIGVYADGYASDITRTFAVGDIGEELKRIYNTVLHANLKAIEAVKPGVAYADIDRAAREHIETAGYGPQFMHRLGHGLGLDVHEYPSVHGANREKLQEGSVFTIEPGIYVAGLGGVRIEDDVLVTASGVEVLTSFPKELTVIG
ncbi:M24 family metallopeptidase [Paenibacillus contaminans]|uniref:Aminopeptidase P family protein n=1 Tax=Paenibacillus contaminans TaxID=450362 RepID=A0A329MLB7_9BACL|nr:Xaa-Pro peptidase family protein [Paenibacillus contaminans]RAV20649.1 aminopeptidase P family protein [Paenibacillus contaminans]